MNIRYDQQVDAAYLTLETAKVVDSEEIQPNVVFDYDELDRVVGIELLCVKRNITNLLQLQKLIPTANSSMKCNTRPKKRFCPKVNESRSSPVFSFYLESAMSKKFRRYR